MSKAVVAITLVVGLLGGLWYLFRDFNLAGSWGEEEVARVTSPSGAVDAVLVEGSGGATTSMGYEVYLVASGEQYKKGVCVAWLYGASRNSSGAYGVNPRWDGSGTLLIEYLNSKQDQICSEHTDVGGESVRVVLVPGILDPDAPPGAMRLKPPQGVR
jgi:hypothetical protein